MISETDIEGDENRPSHFQENSLFRIYLNQISKTPLLTPEEERRLFLEIEEERKKILNILLISRQAMRFLSLKLKEKESNVKKIFRIDPKRFSETAVLIRQLRVTDQMDELLRRVPLKDAFIADILREGRIGSRAKKTILEAQRQIHLRKTRVVEANLRFVVTVVGQHYKRSTAVTFLDRVQTGGLGLMEAVERFKTGFGVKFISYAVWWIRQAIDRGIVEEGDLIRLPVNKTRDLRSWRRRRIELSQGLQRPPQEEELRQEMDQFRKNRKKGGMSFEEFQTIARREIISLDARISEEQGELNNYVGGPSPEEGIIDRIATEEALKNLESILTLDEAQILRTRLNGYTLDETSKILGLKVTRERVRQIEAQALKKIRSQLS